MHISSTALLAMFVVFAAAVIAWSLAVLRWAVSLRRRRRRGLVLLSCAVVAAAALSIAADVHAMHLARRARPSDLAVRIVRREGWWEVEYASRGGTFATANELHLPEATSVLLQWTGRRSPWIANAVCLPQGDQQCTVVAGAPFGATLRFVSLWPPALDGLRVVVQAPEAFDRWFRNEVRPAAGLPAGAAELFRNAGCAYCHVIRGVVDEPWQRAPDLTHFAARGTVGATSLPNRRGVLAGWVVHSRGLQRDSAMPDNALAPRDLHAVVALLESLH